MNLNIVGYDKEKGETELYHMDYLAAAVKVNYAAHGYGGFFTTAILDAHYRKSETRMTFIDLKAMPADVTDNFKELLWLSNADIYLIEV